MFAIKKQYSEIIIYPIITHLSKLYISNGGKNITHKTLNRFLVLYIILFLITAGISGFLVLKDPIGNMAVKGATIYVDTGGGGDYTSIQAAIDNASSGDTIIVANGSYYESININKTDISLVGNSSSDCKIIHHYPGTNIVSDFAAGINITSSGVNVTGFNISVSGNYTYGIRINSTNSSMSHIYNNNISTTGYWAHSIYIINSFKNNITNNWLTTGSRSFVIYLKSSTNNSIDDNTIMALDYLSYGIYLDAGSWYNNLTNNTISTYGRYGFGIHLYEPSKNNLIGNTVTTFGDNSYALYLSKSSNNILKDNLLSTSGGNGYGIYVHTNCDENIITNNTIQTSEPDSEAIYIRVTSNNNEVKGNNITTYGSNTDGIYIFDSYNINISDNRISNIGHGYCIYFYKGINISLHNNNLTGGGIMMYGPWLYNWDSHTLDTSNNINGNPVYYYKNTQAKIIPGTPGEVIMVNCSAMMITNKSFIDGGIVNAYSNTTNIYDCTFKSCSIFSTYSSWVYIVNNSFKNSSHLGFSGNSIYVGPGGRNNLIMFNTIELPEGYGIACYSDQCLISGNTVINRNGTGISVQYCSKIRLDNNSIQTNGTSGYGIEFWSSTNNIIKNNDLEINNYRGIALRGGSSNNNILNNNIKVNNDNVWAIALDGASYCSIENNTIDTNGYRSYGIRLDGGAAYNGIKNNQITTTGERAYGICLYSDQFKVQNDIINNSITTHGIRGYGIYLYQSSDNKIISNNVTTLGSRGDGLYIQEGSENQVIKNHIKTSIRGYGVFLLHNSNNNEIIENTVITSGDSGHGIFSRNSDNNHIIECNITTTGTNSHGFYLDQNNARIINSSISTNAGLGSYDIYAINNSVITSINCNFTTVEVTQSNGGILRVKNYLDIIVYYEDGETPIEDADIEILDNSKRIYTSMGYGGFEPGTDSNGRINTILLTDRWYINWNTPTENVTRVMVKKSIDLPWEEARANVDMSTSHTEIFVASDITAPKIPSNLAAEPVPGGDAINITWDLNIDNNDTKFYNILWLEPKTSQWVQITSISHPMDHFIWSNESLINGSEYQFRIRAVDKISLSSELSEPVRVVHRDYIPPDPPTELKAETISETEIKLGWNPSSSLDVDGYLIYINDSSPGPQRNYVLLAEVDEETTEYEVSNLDQNITYFFNVKAVDEADNPSTFSNEANTTTKAKPKIPRVIQTVPGPSSNNVPVNSSIIITFNMPMNTITVKNLLDIFPEVDHTLSWSKNNTTLTIDFSSDLEYNTTYSITLGQVRSEIGTILEDWPFELSFKTEIKPDKEPEPKPEPEIPELTITSPKPGVVINANENLTISGTSHKILSGLIITVKLDGSSRTDIIDPEGNWSVTIVAPSSAGNYTIKVTVGNLSEILSITVKTTDKPDDNGNGNGKPHGPDDTDDDKDEPSGIFGLGAMMDIIIFLVMVLIIALVALLLVLRLTKKKPEEFDDELEE
jgi:parallel beta-helix repeat protein